MVSESLEDYLETIYQLVNEKRVARVKDIASAREVKMASVSMAMHRLAMLGLIDYQAREFIELTPAGEEIARRIRGRHELIRRFLTDLLGVGCEAAERDACQIEHHLSDETLDHFIRMVEFVSTCPEAQAVQELFARCRLDNPDFAQCGEHCSTRLEPGRVRPPLDTTSLADLKPGEKARITRITASGALRQRLIDMGLLPQTELALERVAPGGDPLWIKVRGFDLSLRRQEARSILVTRPKGVTA